MIWDDRGTVQGLCLPVPTVRSLAADGSREPAIVLGLCVCLGLYHWQLHSATASEMVGCTSQWSAGGAIFVGGFLHGWLLLPDFR